MAPSLLSLGAAALALAGNGAAVQWYLEDTYNSTNFFDKFDFMTIDDPNSGYVNYLGRTEAINAGLAAVQDKEVVLRVDSKSSFTTAERRRGRDSVRLESKARLNQGLMIARFTHLPQSACGTWPAFWTVGDTWPQDGEIDIIENWNLRGVNNPAFHMANAASYGSCRIDSADQSGDLITPNCDNYYTDYNTQWLNQGCVVKDNGPSGGSGGVYAMEWTSDFIKIYSWFPNQVPSNIGSSSPDTSTWGAPTMYLRKDLCNIDKIFKPQRIVLNIAMCGNPVEFSAWEGTCKNTHGDSCRDYVGQNPDAFKDVYFQVQDIRIFNQDAPKTTSTSTTATTMASSSTSKSEISTASATPSTKASSTSKSEISTASATPSTKASSTSKSEISTASATPSTKASSTSKSVKNTSTWKSSNSTLSTVSKSAGSVSVSIASKASDSTVPTVSTQVPVTFSTSVPSLSTRWPNSTIASSVEMTTSTVYTTSTRTITSCQPTVTSCSVGKVTTVTLPLYITICPVSAVETKTPAPKPTKTSANGGNGGNGPEKTTITTKVTKTYTITSCAPTVTNCPVERHPTEATGPKGAFTAPPPFHPSKTTIYNTQTIVSVPQPAKPSGGNNNNSTSNGTSIAKPQPGPSGSQVCVGPSCGAQPSSPAPNTGNGGCTGPNCPPTVVSGAAKQSLSALVVLGAVAAMML
ncbi:Endo-1,3(4)-beta-glucanase [Metarhizium anisopliae]|nr:Endo-1,3(4)-beta-glucanase [Metarhizium anisopliae]